MHTLTLAWRDPAPLLSAVLEDARGVGLPLTPGVAAELRRLPAGRPLPGALRQCAMPLLGARVNSIRLCDGPRVDAFLGRFGSLACCVGPRVLMHREMSTRLANPEAITVLRHELAHVAGGLEDRRLRFWGSEHGVLTRRVCLEYQKELEALLANKSGGPKWNVFLADICSASTNMDYRHRVAHPMGTMAYAVGLVKGEGPRHGEGHNYTNADIAANATLNVREQDRHILMARQEFAHNSYGWIKSLANALHIAQDRCSHREGAKGYGHNDPRCAKKWNPDSPAPDHSMGTTWLRCGAAAYDHAYNNSCDVFDAFFNESVVKAAINRDPHRALRLKEHC